MFEVLEKAVDRCLKGSRIQQLNEIFISALFLDFELKKKKTISTKCVVPIYPLHSRCRMCDLYVCVCVCHD